MEAGDVLHTLLGCDCQTREDEVGPAVDVDQAVLTLGRSSETESVLLPRGEICTQVEKKLLGQADSEA